MTKQQLVARISQEAGIERAVVMAVVEAFMRLVKESLIDGRSIFLRGFGSFIVKRRAAKTARNISKNTTMVIPAHNIPVFKPVKAFLDAVKEGNGKRK